ncbi:protein NO VEIN domain-containing protein [Kitasatospora sp. NPDC017646]|uniref:protein NO VEIN domain-containing protein n=1 Tax=Kitasatospora sp. NPDC017646 TaxID=3364024 RepID=UPI00378DC65F
MSKPSWSTLMTPLPADGAMKAALRWLHMLRTEDAHRARALFTSHTRYADLTPSQYDDGLTWLRRIGLVPLPGHAAGRYRTADRLLRLELLERTLATARPDWLTEDRNATSGVDTLPPAAQRLAAVLDLSHDDTAASISSAWLAERTRLGAAGENALLTLLRRAMTADVIHVSAISDGFGYDIAVESGGSSVHLEVKSTSNAAGQVLFLSRHEYETMRTDPAWLLVFLTLDRRDQPTAISTVDRHWIAEAVPADRQGHGSQWASARLRVPSTARIRGIPAVTKWLLSAAAAGVREPDPSAVLLASGAAPTG